MSKKIIFSLLLALILPLSACGNNADSTQTPDTATQGVETSAAPVTLTVGTAYAPDHPCSIAIEAAMKEISEKSNGTITVEHYPSSQLGDNGELAAGIESGSVDMNIQSLSFFTDKFPEATIDSCFSVYRDADHVYKVWDGEIGDWFSQKMLDAYGVRILDTWLYGTRVFTTKDKPVNSPADLKGLKIRVPNNPIWTDMVASFGANPTPVNLSETYLALSQGVVDGQENPIPTIISSKFNEVQGYLSLTNHKFETIYVIVNENKWQSLSAEQRQIVETAFKNARLINNEQINKQTAYCK